MHRTGAVHVLAGKSNHEKEGHQHFFFASMEVDLFLSYAVNSNNSRGRLFNEMDRDHRSVYQRDRDRIIHSDAFRRLKHKTQVFVAHEGDYFRTRLTHSIEVGQIARTISAALGLNIDLTEAIALAHDLGHTAFGHTGAQHYLRGEKADDCLMTAQ